MFDETFVRAWRLYLAGSQAAFTTGTMQLFQVVFARGASNAIPWTRASSDRLMLRERTMMAMITCDALIVGGGPAGSTCAWKLRQAGLDVMVVDAAVFPRDKVCAGWITPQVVAELDLDIGGVSAGADVPADHRIPRRAHRRSTRKSRPRTVVPSASASAAASSITTCCSDRGRA